MSTRVLVVDWFRVIVDLNRKGYSLRSIAAQIGAHGQKVYGWKNLGARPKYEDGERLIDLWLATTGNTRESLHRVNRYSPKR